MHKVLHFLLIAMIVACPLLCRSGVCLSASECVHVHGSQACCNEHSRNEHSRNGHSRNGHSRNGHSHDGHSHDGHSDHHPSSPHGNAPCGYCQCVCGGAVIDRDDDDVTQQFGYLFHDVVDTNDLIADVPFRKNSRATLAHDGRIPPGRFLCVLHMSFLL